MLSKYFQRSEFSCKCGCGQDTFDAELLMVLEDLREHFNAPVINNSGNRCIAYNEKVQLLNDPNYIPFSSESMHLVSKAADIVVRGYTSIQVYSYLCSKYPGQYGIGYYKNFTHIDVRPFKARW